MFDFALTPAEADVAVDTLVVTASCDVDDAGVAVMLDDDDEDDVDDVVVLVADFLNVGYMRLSVGEMGLCLLVVTLGGLVSTACTVAVVVMVLQCTVGAGAMGANVFIAWMLVLVSAAGDTWAAPSSNVW